MKKVYVVQENIGTKYNKFFKNKLAFQSIEQAEEYTERLKGEDEDYEFNIMPIEFIKEES